MDVGDPPLQVGNLLRRRVGQRKVGNIQISAHSGVVNVIQKAHHLLQRIHDGKVERLKLDGDFDAQPPGVVAQLPHPFHGPLPLVAGGDDFLLPDVFSQHQQEIFGLKLIDKVQMFSGALNVEPAHGATKIRNPQGAAAHTDDGQAGLSAGILDQAPLFDVNLQGVSGNINRVKTDLFGFMNPCRGAHRGTQPGGINEPKFHACSSLISAGRTGRCWSSER